MKQSPKVSTTRGLERGELSLVAAILLCGVVLRIAFPSHLAIEHFDEGVYASNIWFDAPAGRQYPAAYLYAPPLVPLLIEMSLVTEQLAAAPAGGPSSQAAMLPNLLAGCLLLAALWWAARCWFGPRAAIATLALAALSELQALYTRTALTEPWLLLWLLLAVFLYERALSTRNLKAAALAGVCTGLAWWTKYSGWLPLAICLAGTLLRLAVVSQARRRAGFDLACWAITAGVAVAIWCPYVFALRGVGGYAAVLENHRGYVVGLSGWLESFREQWSSLNALDGWLSCLACATALVLVACHDARTSDAQGHKTGLGPLLVPAAFLATALLVLATGLGSVSALFWLSLAGLVAVFYRLRQQAEGGAGELAPWLLLAWFAGLFVVTPLYRHYVRLTLPWFCAAWLAAGVGVATMDVRRTLRSKYVQGRAPQILLALLTAVAATITIAANQHLSARKVTAWQDRSGLAQVAQSIVARIDDPGAVVLVYGEPGLFFHLRAAGVAAVPGFDFATIRAGLPAHVEVYLAAGLHAQRSDHFARQLAAASGGIERVATFAYHPSLLVLLNNYRAAQLASEPDLATAEVRLYRLE